MYQLTFIDVSQFTQEPLRTGVQRVLAKSIECMPRDRIIPFRVLDGERVAILDPALFDLVIRYFERQTLSERGRVAEQPDEQALVSEEELLIKLQAKRPLAVLQAKRFFARAERIVNLEAFSCAERSRFYTSCEPAQRKKVFHFIHDFLLFEVPGVFPQLNWRYASGYVLLFEAYATAGGFFVSTPDMARRVAQYFNRPLSDVKVVHFGGDLQAGDATARAALSPRRRQVTVIGTLEPRKYPLIVAESLEQVAAADPDVDCVVVGQWGWVDADTRRALEVIFARGRVRHLVDIDDVELAGLMRTSHLGIYVSSAEGFGIPVIEFAAAGVLLITNATVPAAALVAGKLCTVLEVVDVVHLTAAIGESLRGQHARTPYYAWTWKDCAREIFDWDPHGGRTLDKDPRSLASWRAAIALVRELRGRHLPWEDLKSEVRVRLSTDKRIAPLAKAARASKAAAQTLVENISEIVSDNLTQIFWADFIQIKPLLAELVRCLSAHSPFDGISRAFTVFLGREIDGRAASEAIRLRDPVLAFARMVDLIHSEEAARSLGQTSITALRAVVRDIEAIVAACLALHLDSFKLMDLLGLPPPSLPQVLEAERRAASVANRLQLLLYFCQRRAIAGDSLDLFLEEVARVVAHGTQNGAAAVAAPPAALTPELSPMSAAWEVPIYSDTYWEGWYAVEYAGQDTFRWMGKEGVIHNPAGLRPVRDFVLEVQHVYGAHEPMVMGFMGDTAANVRVEAAPGGRGWRLHLGAAGEGVLIESVRLQALASDSPAHAEGLPDARELSFCVTGATFVYSD